MVKKVVLFDYWTAGIHNFLPVAERLRTKGVECVLVHLGSWQDLSVPREETIQGLQCRDIRAYGGDLHRALIEEQPQSVLSLNTTMIMDRTLHRLCRSLGIRTVYMMHGLLSTGADSEKEIRSINAHWNLARKLAKVPKYARLSIRYLEAVARHRPIELLYPGTYGHFAQVMLQPGAAFRHPWPHKDGCADEALVYAPAFRDLMVEARGYPPERVKVIGNPNLDEVFALKNRPDGVTVCTEYITTTGLPASRPFVVYVEDGFVEQPGAGWTERDLVTNIDQVGEAARSAGFDLVVKMHPVSRSDGLVDYFADKPYTHIVTKADLPKLIAAAAAVVGHVSTALAIAVAFEKPLFVPTWSPGMEQYKNSYYIGNGAAQGIEDSSALSGVLKEISDGRIPAFDRRATYTKMFIGPTDGNAWNRVADALIRTA